MKAESGLQGCQHITLQRRAQYLKQTCPGELLRDCVPPPRARCLISEEKELEYRLLS